MNCYNNLQHLDQEQAFNLIKFFIVSQQNIFLFGKRGIGKTQLALQAAKACKMKVSYINLSVLERADLIGYPNIFSSEETISFKSPYFLPFLHQDDKPDHIILFDEVDKAAPEITSPLLEILQFKTINGKALNATCCILTGNLIDERSYSNNISSALLDRGSKFILQFNFEKWIDWAKLNNIHDLILGFLNHNPNYISSNDDIQYASPSPRGWTLASDALWKAKKLKLFDSETISQIVSGFVGSEAGLKFKLWYDHYRFFDPHIYSLNELGQMNFNFDQLTPSEKLIFVVSACFSTKLKVISNLDKNKDKFLYLKNLCNFLNNSKIDLELQIAGITNSFNFEMITKYKLYSCQEFFEYFTKLNEKINFKK